MNIEGLYGIYSALSDAGDKILEHSKEYGEAISATRLHTQEKLLGTQIITKFFASFPSLQNKALNAIFDLCEDEDKTIRIAAMKSLPSLCKDTQYICKISEVMGQMLQLDDAAEQTCANNVFLEVLKKEPVTVIKCIFKTINDPGMEALVRYRCIQFILSKIKVLDSALITTEVQDLMIANVRATLSECIADEFVLLMGYLVTTNLVKTAAGRKEISDIVLAQIDIENEEFKPYQPKCNYTNRLVSCVKFILPFFATKGDSTKLVQFYCNNVLKQWKAIEEMTKGVQYQTMIAQQLAIMAPFCGALETPLCEVEVIFNVLLMHMPQAPEDTSNNEMPVLNFSVVEGLLYAFHALARQCPQFLEEDAARLKDFRARLLYFSRGVQGCLKVLALNANEKVFNADDKRIREMSPLLFKNINTLIKDLFYTKPIYKCAVTLSFAKDDVEKKSSTPATKTNNADAHHAVVGAGATATKRHVPITYDSSSNGASHNKQKRGGGSSSGGGVGGEKKLYAPPSGKFSHKIHHRGRVHHGGGFRGARGGRGGGGGYRGGYRHHN